MREVPDVLPAAVRLRPGLPVLRRDAATVQLGVGAAAVLVSGEREVAVVRALAARPVVGESHDPLLARLWAAGALMDAAAWERDRARWPRLADPVHAHDPRGAPQRLLRRAAARVSLDAPRGWVPELRGLLADAGLGGAGADDTDIAVEASVALVVARGEPDRARLDALSARGTPHLLVRTAPERVDLGPFVVPGRTACVRCEDAHRTDADPRWPLLLAQLTEPEASPVAGPEPVLLTWAAAWAVRDLATYAEGGRPATWSARVRTGAYLTQERDELLRHPHCGCAWGEMLREAGPAA